MIQIFQAQHLAEAHLVCNLLHAEGVPAEVHGTDLSSTLGIGSSAPGILPTVWIADSSESERAQALILRFVKGERAASSGPSWNCPMCGEIHEAQFQSCWKCGASLRAPESV
jgi:hypothetical protein